MSDSANVVLTLSADGFRKAEELLGDALYGDNFEVSKDGDGNTLVAQYFDSVNQGVLGVEEVLMENLIPYTKEWGNGLSFGSGISHFRINAKGVGVLKEFDPIVADAIDIDEIKSIQEQGLSGGVDLMDEYLRNYQVITWSEQADIIDNLLSRND